MSVTEPSTFDDGRSNWLWLAELSRWERALEVCSDTSPQTAGLAEHFRFVHCVRVDDGRLRREWQDLVASGYANVLPACAAATRLPYRDGVFDCVALDDVGTQAASRYRVLPECRRILRPGGCLFMGTRSRGLRRLTRALTRAGFPVVRAFGAEPSWDAPRCMIPLKRAAILGYERWVRRSSPMRDVIRLMLARLGARRLLYRSVILLAYP